MKIQSVAPFTVSMLWHPRMDGDLAHRWLRGCLKVTLDVRMAEKSLPVIL